MEMEEDGEKKTVSSWETHTGEQLQQQQSLSRPSLSLLSSPIYSKYETERKQ